MTALDRGTGGSGQSMSLTISDALADSTAATKYAVLPVIYGASYASTDNTTSGPDLVLTFESTQSGVANNNIGLPATSAASGTFSAATVSYSAEAISIDAELHSNLKANAGTGIATSTDSHPDESWSDVTYPEATVAATVTTTAVAKSRIGWL